MVRWSLKCREDWGSSGVGVNAQQRRCQRPHRAPVGQGELGPSRRVFVRDIQQLQLGTTRFSKIPVAAQTTRSVVSMPGVRTTLKAVKAVKRAAATPSGIAATSFADDSRGFPPEAESN